MKITRYLALSVVVAMAIGGSVDARPRPRGFSGGKSFEANKTFGLGLELGAPTGLTGKYFLSDSGALDFGLGANGYYANYYGDGGLHLYGDYLWHPLSLASPPAFELPFYIGVGGRFWRFDYCDRNRFCDGSTAIGIRVPVGIAFDFNTIPIDLFIQIVPTLDFFSGGYRDQYHDVWLDIDFSVGGRFWF